MRPTEIDYINEVLDSFCEDEYTLQTNIKDHIKEISTFELYESSTVVNLRYVYLYKNLLEAYLKEEVHFMNQKSQDITANLMDLELYNLIESYYPNNPYLLFVLQSLKDNNNLKNKMTFFEIESILKTLIETIRVMAWGMIIKLKQNEKSQM